jgi:hypothetical protein
MSNRRNHGSWISSAVLACFVANCVQAATLPCVQRAIDWNAASGYYYVTFSMVSLHESGQGSYSSGRLANSHCITNPHTQNQVSCLATAAYSPSQALLLHPFSQYVSDYLTLSVDGIPSSTFDYAQVHLHQPNATYDFDPVCVGNLLVGNDQWGNHWTISFGFGSTFVH